MIHEYKIAELLSDFLRCRLSYKGRHEFLVAAATLDKRGNIIAIGQNSFTKTHPLMKSYSNRIEGKHKIYLHAEISALIKSKRRVYSMVVVRITRTKKFALSKPCPVCQLAIKESDIRKVYYTNDAGELVLLNQ